MSYFILTPAPEYSGATPSLLKREGVEHQRCSGGEYEKYTTFIYSQYLVGRTKKNMVLPYHIDFVFELVLKG
jgi:hypothetical protein